MQTTASSIGRLPAGIVVPTTTQMIRLAAGGALGLAIWEIWARVLTKAVLGYPLEPAGLIDALAQYNFGLGVNYWVREALHYAVGIIGYPAMYWIFSRHIPKWPLVLDAIVLGTFSAGYLFMISAGKATPVMFIFFVSVVALVASRAINKSPAIADAITWGNYTWFNALGLMAPLGGLSFYLLGEGGELSYMSFVGHVIYGAVAAYVFEAWDGRPSTT
jgi:hypothetical protein